MGDRANVVMLYHDYDNPNIMKEIYFYTHWCGSKLPKIVYDALKKIVRWSDPSYLSRIIFSEMIKNSTDEYTGFGISPYADDNEYPFIYIDTKRNIVSIANKNWTFEEYVNMDEKEVVWPPYAYKHIDDYPPFYKIKEKTNDHD